MSGQTRYGQFLEVVRAHLLFLEADQPLDTEVSLVSLGLNSMEQVSLLIDLEGTFDVIVPDEFLVQQTFANVSSLWAVVERLVPGEEPVGSLVTTSAARTSQAPSAG